MPFQPLTIQPGVAVQPTPLLNSRGWSSCNLIRFKDGLLQKRGGCARLTNETFTGTCRALFPFVDLDGYAYIGIGTDQRLQLLKDGLITDITPVTAENDLTNPFATNSGDSIVTVTDGTAVVVVGDWVLIETAAYVGGIFLQGFYQVVAVGTGTYDIDAGMDATSTVAAGGTTFAFTSAPASTAVTLTLGAWVFTDQQDILVWVSTAVSTVTIAGEYVVTVTGGPTNTITASGAAAGAATVSENGGDVRIAYLIPSAIGVYGTAGRYGAGTYGSGPYGGGAATIFDNQLRQWSLDGWGEFLLASYTNGPICVWQPPIAYDNFATVIAAAPSQNVGMFVSSAQQQIIAYGCTDPISGAQDLLLLRWCDVADYDNWTAASNNQAGSFRLPRGSRIVGGLQGPGYAMIWTDLDLWIMQYVGYPFVYSVTQVGWGCGLISMRGVARLGPVTYWLSQKGFFSFDGQAVRPVPCAVWDQLFDNLDTTYADAIFLASNSYFNEIEAFHPHTDSEGICTGSVKFNVEGGSPLWDYNNNFARSAWYDQSVVGAPIAADYNGLVQQHEISDDLDGEPMISTAETGWIGLDDGLNFVRVDRLLPDLILTEGKTVYFYLTFCNYVNDTDTRTFGPYAATSTTQYIALNGRGRYVRVGLYSAERGVFWRLGKPELLVAPSGRN